MWERVYHIRDRLFTLLLIAWVALFLALMVMYYFSSRPDVHFIYHGELVQYTWRVSAGRLIVDAPPLEGSDDASLRIMVSRTSNADFNWDEPSNWANGWFIRGEPRQGTATFNMFKHFVSYPRTPDELKAAARVWLKALDDPNTFLPAYMMLSGYRGDLLESPQWIEIEDVFLPSTPTATGPDPSNWKALRDKSHAEWDVELWSCSIPAAAALTLIIPVMRLAKPRRRVATTLRWAFNTASALFAVTLLAALVLSIRSYSVTDVYKFKAEAGPLFSDGETTENTIRQWWIVSAKGRLEFRLKTSGGDVKKADLPGHSIGRVPSPNAVTSRVRHRHWSTPGIEFHSLPLSVQNTRSWRMLWNGIWSLTISWWYIAMPACILPTLWMMSHFRYRRRQHRRLRNLCVACGYDLRSSPQRCPECGSPVRHLESKAAD